MMQVNSTLSWAQFFPAVQAKIHGEDPEANEFDSSLWPACFKRYILYIIPIIVITIINLIIRISYECGQTGEKKSRRPALNMGIMLD